VFVNVDRYGNTGAASVYVALEEAVAAAPEERRPGPDGRVRRRIRVGRRPDAWCALQRTVTRAAVHRIRRFLFPGQGSQAVGMGRALLTRPRAAAKRSSRKPTTPRLRPDELMLRGPEADLALTANTQPAVLTASVAAAAAVRRARARAGTGRRPQPRRVLGAVVAAGGAAPSPMPCAWCAGAASSCRRRCRGHRRHGRDHGRRRGRRRAVCAEAGQGEVVEIANVNSGSRSSSPAIARASSARCARQERAGARACCCR
jgi:[acyl-carrier-protein] S-malonyltransferase